RDRHLVAGPGPHLRPVCPRHRPARPREARHRSRALPQSWARRADGRIAPARVEPPREGLDVRAPPPGRRRLTRQSVQQAPRTGADFFYCRIECRGVDPGWCPVATDLPDELQGGVVDFLLGRLALFAAECLDASAHPLIIVRAMPDRSGVDADVAVVGAGPAGAAAALFAARQGRHVVVLEKQAFPRDKPCGEGLMPSGRSPLRELGLDAIVAHWEVDGPVDPWVRITFDEDLEVYEGPVAGNQRMIGLLCYQPRMREFSGRLAARYREIVLSLRPALGDAQLVGSVAAAGPFWYRASTVAEHGVFLVGDAGGFTDPITGEGIAAGLRQARAFAL